MYFEQGPYLEDPSCTVPHISGKLEFIHSKVPWEKGLDRSHEYKCIYFNVKKGKLCFSLFCVTSYCHSGNIYSYFWPPNQLNTFAKKLIVNKYCFKQSYIYGCVYLWAVMNVKGLWSGLVVRWLILLFGRKYKFLRTITHHQLQ